MGKVLADKDGLFHSRCVPERIVSSVATKERRAYQLAPQRGQYKVRPSVERSPETRAFPPSPPVKTENRVRLIISPLQSIIP